MHSTPFDRLAGLRRHRRLRNYWTGVALASLFLLLILGIDPIVSSTAPKWGLIVVLGALLVVSASVATYFHLKFLTRE